MPIRDRAYFLQVDQSSQVVQRKTHIHVLLVCTAVKICAGMRHRQIFIVDIAGYDSIISLVTREWPVVKPMDRSRRYDGDPGKD